MQNGHGLSVPRDLKYGSNAKKKLGITAVKVKKHTGTFFLSKWNYWKCEIKLKLIKVFSSHCLTVYLVPK